MSKNNKKPTVTIIGAGLAGCFLAILFAKRGFTVHMYEKSSRTELISHSSKRSFSLTFYGYGVDALKETGLWNEVKSCFTRLDGSITHIFDGKKDHTILSRNDSKKMPYYAVQRSEFLHKLLTACSHHPRISIHFNTTIIHINRYENEIVIQNTISKKMNTKSFEVLFGADGVNSLVRPFIQNGQESIHTHEFAQWEYKQISFSAQQAKVLKLKPKYAFTWSRKNTVLAGFPNKDGSITTMLILPKTGVLGFQSLDSKEAILGFITTHYPTLLSHIQTITKEILNNPLGSYVTVKTSPWYYQDKIALIGDAAHGFLPFFGQGVSAAFADTMELMKLIDMHGTDWKTIFPVYQSTRKPNTDVIAALSKDIFERYRRYKKADTSIIYDKLEHALNQLFPWFIQPSIYQLVANEQDKSFRYYQRYRIQRKFSRIMGLSLVAKGIYGMLRAQEVSLSMVKIPPKISNPIHLKRRTSTHN